MPQSEPLDRSPMRLSSNRDCAAISKRQSRAPAKSSPPSLRTSGKPVFLPSLEVTHDELSRSPPAPLTQDRTAARTGARNAPLRRKLYLSNVCLSRQQRP